MKEIVYQLTQFFPVKFGFAGADKYSLHFVDAVAWMYFFVIRNRVRSRGDVLK